MKNSKRFASEILKKLDHKIAEYAVRDITFLTCSIFNETHRESFKRLFNFDKFSVVFWYQEKKGHVIFYRSGKEYNLMAERIGKIYLENIKNAEKNANTLIRMSDEINSFIKNHKDIESLIKKWKYFYRLYQDFFAYHQAVYWSSEYLAEIKNSLKEEEKKNVDKIIDILDSAYKYNEIVVPNVESYFIKLGIRHLHFEEINDNTSENIKVKPKERSVVLIDDEVNILSSSDAFKINKAIRDDYNNFLKNKKGITGLAVSKGLVIGKVRVIGGLAQLKDCKKDDILVTAQTRPQYNTFIKLVRAIVTDEGGYLCHASMLAREFNIPCIVGTKNATQVLKDGDEVEVDADKGVVKILKRAENK